MKDWRKFAVALTEILLIFGIFAAYGAWPVPDVNEQYYVGKAIHFWNPNWLGNDPFLNTPDSHWFFYAAFGLLSFLFSQNALVWAGRILIWLLTAVAWRRLSRALVPRRWFAPLTAAAFAFYLESFHLAGEWIIGGVEGKGFAFPFVFWGLALFFERKYNRAWILFGVASAFHVLVGGWVVVATGAAWLASTWFESRRSAENSAVRNGFSRRCAETARAFVRTLPGLLVGGAISLAGLIPALKLDAGATPEIIAEARRIYVFDRLSHHLVASSLPWTFLTRFGLLVLAFALAVGLTALVLRWRRSSVESGFGDSSAPVSDAFDPGSEAATARFFRLESFVVAALAIAGVGLAIDFGSKLLASTGRLSDPRAAAGLLRYYWFRLSDWAVPFGLVFVVARLGAAFRLTDAARFVRSTSASDYFRRGLPLVWAAVGLVVYWAFRFAFCRTARTLAAASAVDGLIPLPKPTEGVSFLAAVDFIGLALTAICAVAAICERRRSTSNPSPAPEPTLRRTAFATRLERGIAPALALWLGTLFVLAPGWRLATFVDLRGTKVIPRSAPPKESIADGWLDACRWVRENTPEDAIFLVPRGCDSFKWEARRAEAGSWKEIPQDSTSMVRWYRKMERFYANPGTKSDSATRWNQPLVVVFINKGRDRVLAESEKYGFQYAIVEAAPYAVAAVPEAARRYQEFVDSDLVYRNEQYVVLKLTKDGGKDGKIEKNDKTK